MHHTPLPASAARQLADAFAVFSEYRRVRALAQPFAGSSMYWKRDGTQEHLVRTRPGERSHERLGPRSATTERLFADYAAPKAALEGQLKSLREQLVEAQYQNKALRAGRAPGTVVAVLRALDDAGLHERFITCGVHALYAYEAAARVRVGPDTPHAAWLGDASRRLLLVTHGDALDTALLATLRRADRTFERTSATGNSAVNARGFEVRWVHETVPGVRPLSSAPCFDHPVVAATGRMAWMRTLAPAAFVATVRGEGSVGVPDHALARHADCVQALLDQQLLKGC